MGRKHVISKKFIDSQAVSADFTSDVINVAQTDSGSIHLVWTAGSSPDIDIYVQVRNSAADSYRNLDFGTAIEISGASGEHEIILNELPFSDLRIFADRASGSATVSATFIMKTKGA